MLCFQIVAVVVRIVSIVRHSRGASTSHAVLVAVDDVVLSATAEEHCGIDEDKLTHTTRSSSHHYSTGL